MGYGFWSLMLLLEIYGSASARRVRVIPGWNALKEELEATVDEFRTKGAFGALTDAALDTVDMATGAASWVTGGVHALLTGEDLEYDDGMRAVSVPPRARIRVPSFQEDLIVPLIDSATACYEGAGSRDKQIGMSSLLSYPKYPPPLPRCHVIYLTHQTQSLRGANLMTPGQTTRKTKRLVP